MNTTTSTNTSSLSDQQIQDYFNNDPILRLSREPHILWSDLLEPGYLERRGIVNPGYSFVATTSNVAATTNNDTSSSSFNTPQKPRTYQAPNAPRKQQSHRPPLPPAKKSKVATNLFSLLEEDK